MIGPRSRPGILRVAKWILPLVAILIGYWALPISGRITITTSEQTTGLWPHFSHETQATEAGQLGTLTVVDTEPWPFVQLTVNGEPAQPQGEAVRRTGTWQWAWTYAVPEGDGYTVTFYHDCHTGCQERGRLAVGAPANLPPAGIPTKLGVVMPSLTRDWHGRSGWVVEVTYALRPEDPYWGVDDLAVRVAQHHAKGLNVLIRVDYEQRQSLPPTEDYVALAEYLAYSRRLARDERLSTVYGLIVGNDYNAATAAMIAPDRPTTPAWYARVFNGYGEDVTHTDNVVQIVRSENPQVKLIVGPLRPWIADQGGALPYPPHDVPWLSYMNTLVALLDETAQAKAAAGIPLAAPDGFDVQAPGSPDAPEMAGTLRADEPKTDLARESWDGAQAGFRLYEDWMAIINSYPSTQSCPIYIVSTNTYNRADGIPPAQNYPAGWLTSALDVANHEPQIKALVWFLDEFPHSDEWDWFSLSEQPGRLVDAAVEFDALLQR